MRPTVEANVEPGEVMVNECAERALAILARWATRRAQRVAKERSEATDGNAPRNRQLRRQDGEERT